MMMWLIIVVALTIGFSFACSISEAAIYSVPPGRVESLRQAGSSNGMKLASLRENMDKPVSAILTLNTIAHTAGATVAGSLVERTLGVEYLTLFSVVFVFAILVFSEIIPKTLGYGHSAFLAPMLAWPIQFLIWMFYPAVVMSQWITRIFKPGKTEVFPTEQDVLSVAHLGVRSGGILPEELGWVENVLHLNNVEADDIMTPAEQMFHLDAGTTIEQVRESAGTWTKARIPITRGGDLSDIMGIVMRHEVVAAICEGPADTKLADIAWPINKIPAHTKGHILLKEMIRLHQHMFIVVDKTGKTLGLVTLEDVIEEMLGIDIIDETDIESLGQRPGRLSRK